MIDPEAGGLDDPEDLQPEQGALALADPADDWSRADWEKAAAAVLRKSRRLREDDPDDEVWQKLAHRTLDGLTVSPLGTPDLLDGLSTGGRPTRAGDWDIRAYVDGSDAAVANREALADLEGGVTSLWVAGAADYAQLLDQVLLDAAPVVLDGAEPHAFLSFAEGGMLHPDTNLGVPATAATAELARVAADAGIRAFVVDATQVHDRGASDVQELAVALATGAAYLRTMDDAGIGVDQAAVLVEFRFAVTDEQLPTIAKLRAARRLWARVLEICGADHRELRLHAVTSRPMTSKYDPWVNLLRTTVAAFAAGVGGADAVTVLPFDAPLGRPDAFGRRMARNTSHLLIDESHVAHVADPAGGSYVVEKLTDDLAVAAWELFGRIEEGADLEAEIAATVTRREADIATRKRPLTGLTEFPNLAEVLPERAGEPDPTPRYGAAFEAMRDEPVVGHVFLATLGTVAQHTARATFASNLLAAGGVPVDPAGATGGVDDLLEKYDGQPVVCLAGADPTYEEWGREAADRLREAGATRVLIAGRPVDYADDAAATGVDALDFLTRTREALS